VQSVPSRPRIDLALTIDGAPSASETTYTWAGAHVLTVQTVIPRADPCARAPFDVCRAAWAPYACVHLRLGPAGHEPSPTSADLHDAQLEPTYAPRACAYEHAQRLIEVLSDLGHSAAVNVPGGSTDRRVRGWRARFSVFSPGIGCGCRTNMATCTDLTTAVLARLVRAPQAA
jgi:hypothetical protein